MIAERRCARGRRGAARSGALLAFLVVAAGAAAESDRPSESPPPEARSVLAEAERLLDAGSYAEARAVIARALEIKPDWLRPRGCLGVIHQAEGNREAALAEYKALQAGVIVGPADQVDVVAGLAAEVVWLTNGERLTRGLRPLKPHPMLALIASRHCEEMRDLRYFAHESPLGGHLTPAERFREVFGFLPRQIAENIARRYSSGGYSLTVESVRLSHQDLMASEGHRGNILGPGFTDLGVGLAANSQGDFWITELFVRFTR